MARTYSETIALGSRAAPFSLPAANPDCDDKGDENRSLADYADAQVIVIVFMCNHCPFVVHVRSELVRMANEYLESGVQFIGINSNDAVRYPDDSFPRMREDAETYGFLFPYLYDESQAVARAYGAVCTPDVFVYDSNRELRYHGRIDETRPGGEPSHGRELRSALDQLISTGIVEGEQIPSIGCNIKWKQDGS